MSPTTSSAPIDLLLIVDTDKMLCELLQYRFENEGFKVHLSHSAEDALSRELGQYAMMLIDLMDEKLTGLKLVDTLRKRPDTFNLPIIIISGVASEDDIVAGLDAGADDYIAKPLSAREVVARVRSVLRRRRALSARRMSNVIRYEGLQVDLGTGVAAIDGKSISLSRTEFLILAMLLRHRGQFFDRAEIHHEAWDDDSELSAAAVNTYISRLRKKIGDYGRHIINRQGYGYGFVD
ncbi:MAG: response regulator transcription factor [Bacteroidales bacterium]|nr:response regulator transcription factor [Bacteroidales bacterium]